MESSGGRPGLHHKTKCYTLFFLDHFITVYSSAFLSSLRAHYLHGQKTEYHYIALFSCNLLVLKYALLLFDQFVKSQHAPMQGCTDWLSALTKAAYREWQSGAPHRVATLQQQYHKVTPGVGLKLKYLERAITHQKIKHTFVNIC